MIRSMTAFAREEITESWGTAVWEVRSVNFRYLDVGTRTPEDLRALEPMIRERVSKRLSRGKVDCTLRFQVSASAGGELTINHDLVARLSRAGEEVRSLLGDGSPVRVMDILRWPGVIDAAPQNLDEISTRVLELLDQAIDNLVAMRAREGGKIHTLIEQRCEQVLTITTGLQDVLPTVQQSMRVRLSERLMEVAEQLDSQRLEQEMVLFSNKMDVSEELDRLKAHTDEVRRVLTEKKPVGRRLDFLMQEMNREANTLGSKSVDNQITRASVDLKVLIEQMREQIQNVE